MPANKIILNGETLIDLTGDSVKPETLLLGETAHDASGNPITGTMEPSSGGDDLDDAISEQEALVTELQGILDQKAAGSSEEINLGTCTVIIKPVASTNHYVCRETVASDGTVSYAISKSYTSSNISVKVRCDSVMYVQVSNATSAEVTGAELLKFISGQGVVIKTPSDNGATATITLKA